MFISARCRDILYDHLAGDSALTPAAIKVLRNDHSRADATVITMRLRTGAIGSATSWEVGRAANISINPI